jgi:quinol monooxygenase YgiN
VNTGSLVIKRRSWATGLRITLKSVTGREGSMYGTIFRMKIKPGKERELRAAFDKWELERKPKVAGEVASLVLKSGKVPDEFFGVAVFKDKESYTANAKDPEQDKWYRQMRLLLQSDPEWNDGDYIFAKLR